MTEGRQVWVTGLGVVSSLGVGVASTWEALLAGESGVGPIDSEAARAVDCQVGAEVKNFKARKLVPNRKSLKIMTRPVRLGVAAAALAWQDAGLSAEDTAPERLGVFVGAGQAFADRSELEPALERSYDGQGGIDMVRYGQEGLGLIHPLWLLRGLSNNVLGFVSLDFNAQGINNNYANSGVSSTQAIIMAARAIADGMADACFAGGYDTLLSPECLVGYGRLGLLSQGALDDPSRAHRPFDKRRAGLVPAEGACFLMLESAEHAMARGATPLARVSGGAVTAEALAVVDASAEGTKLIHATRRAMSEARIGADEVDAIFAHGAALPHYDAVEIAAYREVFGERLGEVSLTADKAALGHTVAAAGAMSAAMATMSLKHGVLPPIASLGALDPACEGPRYVLGEPRAAEVRHALIASAGLGGQAGTLILSRAEPKTEGGLR